MDDVPPLHAYLGALTMPKQKPWWAEIRAPWRGRVVRPLTVKHRTMYGTTPYDVMSDGSLRNTNHQRHERRFFGLTARQHRMLTKASRREDRLKPKWERILAAARAS